MNKELKIIFSVIILYTTILVTSYYCIEKSLIKERVLQERELVTKDTTVIDTIAVIYDTISLNTEEVLKQLEKHEILQPKIVLKQSILETGWYKCKDCSLDYNNLFGFRWKGEYLKFDNWIESIKYYKWWQDRKYPPKEDYYAFLKRVGYATSKTYIRKLKQLEIH